MLRPYCPSDDYVFIEASDLTGKNINVYALGNSELHKKYKNYYNGTLGLKFIPVTKESVEDFYRLTYNPPTKMNSISDQICLFGNPTRAEPDQVAAGIVGPAEVGLSTIGFGIARGVCWYQSTAEGATIYPSKSGSINNLPSYKHNRPIIMKKCNTLEVGCDTADSIGAEILGWLTMNRWYDKSQLEDSVFQGKHQYLRERWKSGKREAGRFCYFFPELRKERISLLVDAVKQGTDGVLIGCARQPPMMLYHPKMVEAYIKETGINPMKLNYKTERAKIMAWAKWRAKYFTMVLEELKPQLKAINPDAVIAIRILAAGFDRNLLQGLDVKDWARKGLIDRIWLDPIADGSTSTERNVRPYITLGRQFNIEINGGIGRISYYAGRQSFLPPLKTTLGMIETGVDGIEYYETENFACASQYKWWTPVYGNAKMMRYVLDETNIEACWPITSGNACFIYDNHSFQYYFPNESL